MSKNEFDNALLTKAVDESNDTKDWVIRPLIFDAEEECPVSTPILSELCFKTISDSALEIIDCGKFDKYLDGALRNEAYKNLTIDMTNNVLHAIINSIIESSTLSFNAWCEYTDSKYFPSPDKPIRINNYVHYFYNSMRDENNRYYKSLNESVTRFIVTTLSFNESNQAMNKDPKVAISEGMFNRNYYNFIENTAINIANLIGIAMVDSISHYLFISISLPGSDCYIMNELKKKSPTLKKLSESRKEFSNFVHTAIEYILEDSLYELIRTCIKPSVFNILQDSVNTFFFMYQDLNLNTDMITKQNEK